MAELIMTEEERTTAFLKWDNAALGKAVKCVADIFNDDKGDNSLKATGAAIFLIQEALRAHTTELTVNLTEAYDGEANLGNWKITIEKV